MKRVPTKRRRIIIGLLVGFAVAVVLHFVTPFFPLTTRLFQEAIFDDYAPFGFDNYRRFQLNRLAVYLSLIFNLILGLAIGLVYTPMFLNNTKK